MVLLGGLTAGLASARIVKFLGRDRTRHFGMGLLALGCGAIAAAPGLWATLLGAYICGCGISSTVNALNPSVVDHHGKSSASVLTLLNAGGATLGACAPLALSAAIKSGIPWRVQVLAVTAVALILLTLARTSFPAPNSTSSQIGVEGNQSHNSKAHARGHGVLFGLIVTALALGQLVEFSTGIYAVNILRSNGNLTAAAASAFAAAFITGFALGRWLMITLALRYSAVALGCTAAVLSGFGAGWAACSPSAIAIAAGLFVLGLGNGPAYPLLVSAALTATKSDRDRASATIAIAGGGCAAFATLTLGFVADAFGMSAVFVSLSGTAAVSAGVLLCALFYDRNHGGSVPTQRSVGV